MTAKEYLGEARTLRIRIKGKQERIKQLQELAESTTYNIAAERVSGGSNTQKIPAVVSCIADFRQEIAEDTAKLIQRQREIQCYINQMHREKLKTVLELYYLNGLTFQDVAERMDKSVRHITRLHGDALQEIEKEILKCPVLSYS